MDKMTFSLLGNALSQKLLAMEEKENEWTVKKTNTDTDTRVLRCRINKPTNLLPQNAF